MVATASDRRVEQLKLVSEYVKFHLGLYLATPPILAVVADAMGVAGQPIFKHGMLAMIAIYLLSGLHAGYFMGEFVNRPWKEVVLEDAERAAFSPLRRALHHWLYWLGLAAGVAALFMAFAQRAA